MRVAVLFLILLGGFLTASFFRSRQTLHEEPAFELVRSLYVTVSPHERFDLSGILKLTPELKEKFGLKGDFLLVNDQTSFIYVAQLQDNTLYARPWIDLAEAERGKPRRLQDIDSNNRSIFALDETDGEFFEIHPELNRKNKVMIKLFGWTPPNDLLSPSSPYGGLGSHENQIYLGKEKAEQGVFQLEILDDEKPTARRFNRESEGYQTSIRIRGSHVYILDSQSRCVWEEKLVGTEKPKALSFRKYNELPEHQYSVFDDKKVARPEWGTASALEIDGDTFYIGLDNNGEGLVANPKETRAAVMVLRRKH
jgi:hypothetical protein